MSKISEDLKWVLIIALLSTGVLVVLVVALRKVMFEFFLLF